MEAEAEGAARFTLEVFALKIVRAMELLTILNQCHHHRGFVYQHARFGADNKSIEVDVRPREGSAAVCSGCHRPAPGYDHLPERRFECIPLWGVLVFFREPAVLEARDHQVAGLCNFQAQPRVRRLPSPVDRHFIYR